MEPGVHHSEPQRSREPYVRPELVAIELKAEQVLSVGCKDASPKANTGQPACGTGVPCLAAGS